MSKPIAAEGSLVDIRNVSTHKVVRLVIDVPAEKAGEIIAMFGWPTQVDPVPVAIAKLDMRSISDAKTQTEKNAVAKASDSEDRPAPQEAVAPPDDGHAPARTRPVKQTWDSMLPAQQCGVLCNEAAFWLYLQERKGWLSVDSADEAADAVRSILNVGSRRDIRPGSKQATEWTALASDFRLWKQYPEYVGAA